MSCKKKYIYIYKNATVLSVLIKEFENSFKISEKIVNFFCMFATPFSVKINPLATNFQLQYIELQSDIQLKTLIISLY